MRENKVAKIINVVAIVVLISGIIGSFILTFAYMEADKTGGYYYDAESLFNIAWIILFAGVLSSVVSWALLKGLSELIEYQYKTYIKLKK